MQKRKERQEELEEAVAKEVTNDTAKNEQLIIDELNNIDFDPKNSHLPKEVLEYKSNPKQPCGDLEYAARSLRRLLLKDPQNIEIDIRKIDEQLLILARLFRQAVEQGDLQAAYAAKGALAKGLSEIRTRIPQQQPELTQQFVEVNAKYLENWITLVDIAQSVDKIQRNVDSEKALHEGKVAAEKEKHEELKKLVTTDKKTNEAFKDILENNTPADRLKWTDEQREMQTMLVDQRWLQIQLEVNGKLLEQNELKLSNRKNQMDMLQIKLREIPVVEDANLYAKYQEQIEELFQEMAENDVAIDKFLKSADEIEGQLQQLEEADGNKRLKETASEQARNELDRISEEQEEYVKSAQRRNKDLMENLGLMNDEELEERRRQAEEQEQAAYERAWETYQETNRETEQQYEEEDQTIYN
ncbi:MAG: hypothetical protein LUD78_12610 [Clostridiales bacterium]|nr:hypothetical protein [Clostridiales bacterium]